MFDYTNMLILKVTRDCNLRCSYCYVRNKDNYKGERISFDLFTKVVDKIIQDKIKSNTTNQLFNLIFHGGEPLLYSADDLARMMEYAASSFVENNIKYSFGMQTNLTRLSKEISLVLNKYDVSVGISFDGIEDGNISRTSAFNVNNFESKFQMLNDYNISYGFLMVAGEQNKTKIKKSVEFLKDKYGIKDVKINYAEDVNNVGGEISGEEFFENAWKPFLDEFLETNVLMETNLDLIVQRFVINSLTHTKNNEPSNCGLKICGGGVQIIEMNPDGTIYLCGRYSEDFEEAYVQHVLDEDFLNLNQIKKYLDFVKKKHDIILKVGCDTCPADKICDHGCMAFHYSKFGKYGIREDLVCEIFKRLNDYLVKNQVQIIKALFNSRKDKNNKLRFPARQAIKLNNSQSFKKLEKDGIYIKYNKGFLEFEEK